jgi:hypothetical protein
MKSLSNGINSLYVAVTLATGVSACESKIAEPRPIASPILDPSIYTVPRDLEVTYAQPIELNAVVNTLPLNLDPIYPQPSLVPVFVDLAHNSVVTGYSTKTGVRVSTVIDEAYINEYGFPQEDDSGLIELRNTERLQTPE